MIAGLSAELRDDVEPVDRQLRQYAALYRPALRDVIDGCLPRIKVGEDDIVFFDDIHGRVGDEALPKATPERLAA